MRCSVMLVFILSFLLHISAQDSNFFKIDLVKKDFTKEYPPQPIYGRHSRYSPNYYKDPGIFSIHYECTLTFLITSNTENALSDSSYSLFWTEPDQVVREYSLVEPEIKIIDDWHYTISIHIRINNSVRASFFISDSDEIIRGRVSNKSNIITTRIDPPNYRSRS